MTTLELQLEQTRAELRRLSSAVEQLVATTPQSTKQWLELRELAQLLGISTRTLAVWRTDSQFRKRGVLDREMREHITKLREQMAQLEQGRPIDV